MKLSDLSTSWSNTIAIIVLIGLLFWGYGCPSKTQSLLYPEKKITRPELQVELDSIISTAQYRLADLDRQDEIRDIIFKNALLMVETGTLNPVGIITMLAGVYGAVHGVKHIKDRIEKKTTNS